MPLMAASRHQHDALKEQLQHKTGCSYYHASGQQRVSGGSHWHGRVPQQSGSQVTLFISFCLEPRGRPVSASYPIDTVAWACSLSLEAGLNRPLFSYLATNQLAGLL
jgi:hypothetical protein